MVGSLQRARGRGPVLVRAGQSGRATATSRTPRAAAPIQAGARRSPVSPHDVPSPPQAPTVSQTPPPSPPRRPHGAPTAPPRHPTAPHGSLSPTRREMAEHSAQGRPTPPRGNFPVRRASRRAVRRALAYEPRTRWSARPRGRITDALSIRVCNYHTCAHKKCYAPRCPRIDSKPSGGPADHPDPPPRREAGNPVSGQIALCAHRSRHSWDACDRFRKRDVRGAIGSARYSPSFSACSIALLMSASCSSAVERSKPTLPQTISPMGLMT